MILTETRIKEAAMRASRERLTESINFDFCQSDYDLFISHSFKDKNMVIGLYQLFNEVGYKVYIDWIDDSSLNRTNVTLETANIIRERIKSCKGMAYISTSNSSDSKWCPWELGLSDGLKGKVCILPVMDSDFKGQEYLSLYPYLDYEKVQNSSRFEFWVNDQRLKNRSVTLKKWLG